MVAYPMPFSIKHNQETTYHFLNYKGTISILQDYNSMVFLFEFGRSLFLVF